MLQYLSCLRALGYDVPYLSATVALLRGALIARLLDSNSSVRVLLGHLLGRLIASLVALAMTLVLLLAKANYLEKK